MTAIKSILSTIRKWWHARSTSTPPAPAAPPCDIEELKRKIVIQLYKGEG